MEATLSQVFDRSWADTVMKEAAVVQSKNAEAAGEAAQRRVELLELRFSEGLSIAAIAERWQEDPARLHHEYATARDEFRAALLEVLSFFFPNSPGEAEREARELVGLFASAPPVTGTSG